MNWFKRIFNKEEEITLEEKTIIEEMIKIRPTVAKILLEQPETKDNDKLLLCAFWEFETKGRIKECSYKDFKKMLTEHTLTNFETIRRTRAKIQELHPEYRGELYEIRNKCGKYVTNQMKMVFD